MCVYVSFEPISLSLKALFPAGGIVLKFRFKYYITVQLVESGYSDYGDEP